MWFFLYFSFFILTYTSDSCISEDSLQLAKRTKLERYNFPTNTSVHTTTFSLPGFSSDGNQQKLHFELQNTVYPLYGVAMKFEGVITVADPLLFLQYEKKQVNSESKFWIFFFFHILFFFYLFG